MGTINQAMHHTPWAQLIKHASYTMGTINQASASYTMGTINQVSASHHGHN